VWLAWHTDKSFSLYQPDGFIIIIIIIIIIYYYY